MWSDGHTIATTSRRPMTTDDHRQPSTTNYRPIFRSTIGCRPVADQSPTNCQSLGDRTPTEIRIIIKSWKPIGDWLSQNQQLVGNHSAIDCQAHKRSFDVMHKFVTSFVFLMHRKDFWAKIWTLFLKRNCNIGFPAQFHKCVVWFHIQSIQIHDTCDRRGESSFKFIFVRSN